VAHARTTGAPTGRRTQAGRARQPSARQARGTREARGTENTRGAPRGRGRRGRDLPRRRFRAAPGDHRGCAEWGGRKSPVRRRADGIPALDGDRSSPGSAITVTAQSPPISSRSARAAAPARARPSSSTRHQGTPGEVVRLERIRLRHVPAPPRSYFGSASVTYAPSDRICGIGSNRTAGARAFLRARLQESSRSGGGRIERDLEPTRSR